MDWKSDANAADVSCISPSSRWGAYRLARFDRNHVESSSVLCGREWLKMEILEPRWISTYLHACEGGAITDFGAVGDDNAKQLHILILKSKICSE